MIQKKAYAKILLGFFCLILLAGITASLVYGYEETVNHFIFLANQQANVQKIKSLLTPEKFQLIQACAVLMLFGFGVIFYWVDVLSRTLSHWTKVLFVSARNTLLTIYKSEAKFILFLPIFASVYYAIALPVSYDEAWTYLNFTSRGIFASACYYPMPNNHILHSLITNATAHLPFWGDLFKLRISSIVVNVLIWIIAFAFLSRHFGKKMAVIVVSVASMLFMSMYYSYMSRGYGLLTLCFMVSLFATFNIIRNGNQAKDWIWLTIASILGFYAIPSFLYPFLTIQFFILLHGRQFFRRQFITGFFISLITVLLYLPIIIINGIGALAGNEFVKPLDRSLVLELLPGFAADVITEITGISWVIVVMLLALSFIVKMTNKERQNRLLFMVFLLSPFILLTLHSVIPFGRTFVYCGFLIVFLIALPFRKWIDRMNFKIIIPVLIIIQCGMFYNFNRIIYQYEDFDIVSDKVLNQIKGNKTYVAEDGLLETLLKFKLQTEKFDVQVKTYGVMELSADSISNTNCVIINKNIDKTTVRKPKITTKYYSVY
jgi:hypothetical protein